MRCYRVLVHGRLDWHFASAAEDEFRPRGLYCHRYVLAASEDEAREIAFRRVRQNFDRMGNWLSDGKASLELAADEVAPSSFLNLLRPDNRGHTFYDHD